MSLLCPCCSPSSWGSLSLPTASPPGEGAPTLLWGGRDARCCGCGLIRGAPLCGRRLLSAACINHALQPFRRERHSLL